MTNRKKTELASSCSQTTAATIIASGQGKQITVQVTKYTARRSAGRHICLETRSIEAVWFSTVLFAN